MSWQTLNVKLPACRTEKGEGPTVLYGMLVNRIGRCGDNLSVLERRMQTKCSLSGSFDEATRALCSWTGLSTENPLLEARRAQKCLDISEPIHSEQLVPNCRTMVIFGGLDLTVSHNGSQSMSDGTSLRTA
jgi:hypothetical protein